LIITITLVIVFIVAVQGCVMGAALFGSESWPGDLLLAAHVIWAPAWKMFLLVPWDWTERFCEAVPVSGRVIEVLAEIQGRHDAIENFRSGDLYLIGSGWGGHLLVGLELDPRPLPTTPRIVRCSATFSYESFVIQRTSLIQMTPLPDLPRPPRIPPDYDVVTCILDTGESVEIAIPISSHPCIVLPEYAGHNRQTLRLIVEAAPDALRPEGHYLKGSEFLTVDQELHNHLVWLGAGFLRD
jgi:hypothetical protein